MASYRHQLRGIAAYAVAPALGLATGPILAHALGPAGRGELAALIQPVTVATGLAALGIPAAVTYFTARATPNSRLPYRLGLRVLVTPVALTMIFLAVLAHFTSSQFSLSYWLVLSVWAFTIANAIATVRRAWIQGLARMRRLDIERVSGSVLRAGGVVALALLGVRDAGAFAITMMVTFVLGALVLWLPRVPGMLQAVDGMSRRAFVSFAGTASIATVASFATSRLDQVLMATETSSSELGYYAVSVTIAEVPLVLGVLAGRDALQLASAGASVGRILRHSVPYLGVAILGSAVLAVTADWYTPLFFGADFAPAVLPTQLLLIGTAIGVVAVMVTAVLTGWRRPGFASIAYASGLLVTVVGFCALWGSVGATQAAVISVLTQLVTFAVATLLLLSARRSRVDMQHNVVR